MASLQNVLDFSGIIVLSNIFKEADCNSWSVEYR